MDGSLSLRRILFSSSLLLPPLARREEARKGLLLRRKRRSIAATRETRQFPSLSSLPCFSFSSSFTQTTPPSSREKISDLFLSSSSRTSSLSSSSFLSLVPRPPLSLSFSSVSLPLSSSSLSRSSSQTNFRRFYAIHRRPGEEKDGGPRSKKERESFSSSFDGGENGRRTKKKEKKNYYEVLGIERSASQEDIKKAYVELVKIYHPDQNPSFPTEAAEKFQEIHKAYSTLHKKQSRTLYDQQLNHKQFLYTDKVDVQLKKGRRESTATGSEDFRGEIWREVWEAETPEQRAAREERYKRYAAGQRADLPYVDSINPTWGVILVFLGVFSFSAYCNERDKKKLSSKDSPLDDEFTEEDFRGDRVVSAFFNPFSATWERFSSGYEPPPPDVLYQSYQQAYPHISFNKKSLPSRHLTVAKLPRSETAEARLVKDQKTGEILWISQIDNKKSQSSA